MRKFIDILFRSRNQKRLVSFEEACRNASGDMCIYCKSESIHRISS